MKSILLYETKTGTSKKVATLLSDCNQDCEIHNLKDYKESISTFDTVTIVTPIYMGQIQKKTKNYLLKNKKILLTKKTQIVLVGTNEKTLTQTIENCFDVEEREQYSIIHVGGAYNFNKLNFLQKLIIKKFTGVTESTDLLQYETLKNITV